MTAKQSLVEAHIHSAALAVVGGLCLWTLVTVRDMSIAVATQNTHLQYAIAGITKNSDNVASLVKLSSSSYSDVDALRDFSQRDEVLQALRARLDALEAGKGR